MGLMYNGVVYALWDYSAEFGDELSFREGDSVTVLRRDGLEETDWWWATLHGQEGYVPRNYFGVSPEEMCGSSDGCLSKGLIPRGGERGRRESPLYWGGGAVRRVNYLSWGGEEETIIITGDVRENPFLEEEEPLAGSTS